MLSPGSQSIHKLGALGGMHLQIFRQLRLHSRPPTFTSVRLRQFQTDIKNMDETPPAQRQQVISRYIQQSQERIFENNKKWVAAKIESDPKFFDKLSIGQQPEYL
jgi:hypothetical protein